ncbi:hypothetical protein ACHAPQ_012184 [Fusarium lateritium]
MANTKLTDQQVADLTTILRGDGPLDSKVQYVALRKSGIKQHNVPETSVPQLFDGLRAAITSHSPAHHTLRAIYHNHERSHHEFVRQGDLLERDIVVTMYLARDAANTMDGMRDSPNLLRKPDIGASLSDPQGGVKFRFAFSSYKTSMMENLTTEKESFTMDATANSPLSERLTQKPDLGSDVLDADRDCLYAPATPEAKDTGDQTQASVLLPSALPVFRARESSPAPTPNVHLQAFQESIAKAESRLDRHAGRMQRLDARIQLLNSKHELAVVLVLLTILYIPIDDVAIDRAMVRVGGIERPCPIDSRFGLLRGLLEEEDVEVPDGTGFAFEGLAGNKPCGQTSKKPPTTT